MSSQVNLASTKWTGGNAIQLIEKIHSVVLQSKNNYKKILDTLHTLFSSSELEKTKIIMENRIREAKERMIGIEFLLLLVGKSFKVF